MSRQDPRVLRDGIGFGESVRWHGGRVWFADWARHDIVAMSGDGGDEVALHVDSSAFPLCFDWTETGALLAVAGDSVRRFDADAAHTHADLREVSRFAWNEICAGPGGLVFVNNIGFDFPGGTSRPGCVAVIRDGVARRVADGLEFPNGMAVTPDGTTLIVAESYAHRLTAFRIGADGALTERRVWASLGDGVPDGISVDAEGAVWYADVPNACCRRVSEGGAILDTVSLDRGCFSCAVGGDGAPTLYIAAQSWGGAATAGQGATGQLVAVDVDAPAAR